jgi:hypothetical protein
MKTASLDLNDNLLLLLFNYTAIIRVLVQEVNQNLGAVSH